MKYLAACLGLEAANTNYSRIWCKCPTQQRHDTCKTWEMNQEQLNNFPQRKIQLHAKTKEKYGCIQQPLFPSILKDHVISDILHLFLRISDALINLLILDLRRMDGIAKTRLDQYMTILNVNRKIPFHTFVNKETKHLKWRDLTGSEKSSY